MPESMLKAQAVQRKMSADAGDVQPLRIAIIGSGISGLAAAYLLSKKHHVCIFESEVSNNIGNVRAILSLSNTAASRLPSCTAALREA